jgi:hypothetical protein
LTIQRNSRKSGDFHVGCIFLCSKLIFHFVFEQTNKNYKYTFLYKLDKQIVVGKKNWYGKHTKRVYGVENMRKHHQLWATSSITRKRATNLFEENVRNIHPSCAPPNVTIVRWQETWNWFQQANKSCSTRVQNINGRQNCWFTFCFFFFVC